jgi:hypothetical protein
MDDDKGLMDVATYASGRAAIGPVARIDAASSDRSWLFAPCAGADRSAIAADAGTDVTGKNDRGLAQRPGVACVERRISLGTHQIAVGAAIAAPAERSSGQEVLYFFFAPAGSKAPLLKMSDDFELGPIASSFLKKFSDVNRSSPAEQAS